MGARGATPFFCCMGGGRAGRMGGVAMKTKLSRRMGRWLALAGVALCALATVAAPARAGELSPVAHDESTDEAYEDGWGQSTSGGEGFGPWRQTGDSTPGHTIDDGFVVFYDGGYGRSFDETLESGKFTATAWHTLLNRFSGFAIYGEGNVELLRVGYSYEQDREVSEGLQYGFFFCTNAESGVNAYSLLEEVSRGDVEDVPVDYEITWSTTAEGMLVDVSLTSDGEVLASMSGIQLSTALPVEAFGALVAGTSTSDRFRFDNLAVYGPPVPEPGTMALLALGVAALAARRLRRR